MGSPANRKCDKYLGSLRDCPGEWGAGRTWSPLRWPSGSPPSPGSSSDKTLDYTIHWSRTSEPEALGPAASEDTVTSVDWKPGRDLRSQSREASPFPDPDPQEHSNDRDLLKRHHSVVAKVTPTPKPFPAAPQSTAVGLGGGCGAGGVSSSRTLTWCVLSAQNSTQHSAGRH